MKLHLPSKKSKDSLRVSASVQTQPFSPDQYTDSWPCRVPLSLCSCQMVLHWENAHQQMQFFSTNGWSSYLKYVWYSLGKNEIEILSNYWVSSKIKYYLKYIQAYNQLGRKGRSPLPIFKNMKKLPWFWKKMPCFSASIG